MNRIFKKDGTKIIGAIVLSTVEQLKFLGIVGEEVLEKFNLKEIDKEKFYPRTIRGKIHQIILERYGEKALYYLGVEQFNSVVSENVFKSSLKNQKFNLENFKQVNNVSKKTNHLETQRMIRERLIKILLKIYAAKGAIIAKNDKISTSFKYLDKDILLISITNAVYKLHHEFNRGSLLNFLIKHLGDYWEIKAKYINNQSEFRIGLTKNVFQFDFSLRKKKVDQYLNHLKFRSASKDEFLKAVLDESEKQRSIALEQSKKMENISKKIGKYIPPQIHEGLFKGLYNTEIQTKRKKLTIFFSDIKNFTDTSEKLQPEDLTKYLNEYFSEMTNIALKFGATIDKYIGDAMMLFFGDPNSKGERNDARACVKMSLAMQEKMTELRLKWKDEGFYNPFEIRIGINTGYCNVGNFGSNQRLTYTIIGGEVNVAARLESIGEAGGVLMSYETYAHVQDIVEVEEKDSVKMKGINREIKIFSILNRKNNMNKNNKVINNYNNGNITSNIKKNHESEIREIQNSLKTIQEKVEMLSNKIRNNNEKL